MGKIILVREGSYAETFDRKVCKKSILTPEFWTHYSSIPQLPNFIIALDTGLAL
ncbi:MAG: hypothetical protein A4E54_01086 [Pelotomaculum sp. PtaB.Bin117]|nr:MAG: hypothetical protein A4E54_01086 [Pelotomaculum sp. PtaB.Bin117]OPY59973.1 MAG: hypothetical protein A4E56_02977 [Pelotomaculum sp. PtaU1.Bin065]